MTASETVGCAWHVRATSSADAPYSSATAASWLRVRKRMGGGGGQGGRQKKGRSVIESENEEGEAEGEEVGGIERQSAPSQKVDDEARGRTSCHLPPTR